MNRYFAIFLCAAAALASGAALAQTYPSKPIELLVPANVGAGSDIFARFVADIIRKEKLVSQPIVIVNKGGGGGAIGAAFAAEKRGDPYTVVSFPTGMMLTVGVRSGLDVGLDKFQPIALLGFDISCLMVNADAPSRACASWWTRPRPSPSRSASPSVRPGRPATCSCTRWSGLPPPTSTWS
jgi:tripartite-type tricarboxylate transporter receptor subunit TctC